MTDTPPMPTTPPPPPGEPKKKNRTNSIIIGSAAAVIAAVVATGIIVVQATNNTDRDSKPAASASETAADVETAADEPDLDLDLDPEYTEPLPSDFTIELRTTERQCFGSAGCSVTVEPKLTYDGLTSDLDPAAVYEITYEITGDESGPIIETAELSDQTTLNYTPTALSTASSGTKVSAEITDVVTSSY